MNQMLCRANKGHAAPLLNLAIRVASGFSTLLRIVNSYFNFLLNRFLGKNSLASMHDNVWKSPHL